VYWLLCGACTNAEKEQLISRPLGRIDPWGLVVVNARDIEIDKARWRRRVMSGGVYYSSGNNDGDAHADSHLVSFTPAPSNFVVQK